MLRLRQVCLIASALEPAVEALTSVLGIKVAHRDPAVATFGLANAVMPVGEGFIEVVAPIEKGTSATRFLERRGPGGYMVILDTDDLAPWRPRLAERRIRIAADLAADGYAGLQLHPRDTGGPLLEINWSAGWEGGTYHPAGHRWRDHACPGLDLIEATIASSQPEALSRRWAAILGQSVEPGAAIALDRGLLRFAPADTGGETVAGITIAATDPAAIRQAGLRRGYGVGPDFVDIAGIRVRLVGGDTSASKEASDALC